MILALSFTVLQNLQQHQVSKPPHLLELSDAEDNPAVIQTHLVPSYDHAGINL
jgi:hypothetical protein